LEVLGDDAQEREETIQLVTGELDRMSRIVEDLLVLARAEQPDFIQAHPIDLAEFADELAVKASSLSGRKVALTEVAPAVVQGDRQRLTQAVMNLVGNAFEHTRPDVKVSLGAHANGTWTRISVTDDGQGIAADERQRLFERFARGRSGRRRTEGAGLGLSIVKAIAEGHGGTVELETGDQGSTFTIVIPTNGPETGEQD
jgi:signal transduction histidine kinase